MHDREHWHAALAAAVMVVAGAGAAACGSSPASSPATSSSQPSAGGSAPTTSVSRPTGVTGGSSTTGGTGSGRSLDSCLVGSWVDNGAYLHGMTLTLTSAGSGVVDLSHAFYTTGATIAGTDDIQVESTSNSGPYLELESEHSTVTVKTDIDTTKLPSFWDSANYTCTSGSLTLTWNSESSGWIDGIVPPPFTLVRG
jgi:hypothetical protein